MKTNIKIAIMTIAIGFIALATTSVMKAETVETTKGERTTTVVEELPSLRTVDDFRSLSKGDKIVAYCPMMKKTFVTTIRDVDSKGHAVIRETGEGYEVGGCNITLKKKAGSKEVDSVMTCPDGKVVPVECSKM